MTCRDVHETASLWLAWPGVWMSMLVVALGFSVTSKSVYKWLRGDILSNEEILITGIFVGFLFGSFDSTYWEIPWSLNYIGSESTNWWISMGVFPNLYFRQIGDILASGLHLVAFARSLSPKYRSWLWLSVLGSFVVGGLFLLALESIK